MPDFRAKVHQKSISALPQTPDPLAGFGSPTSKGRGGERREDEGREREGGRKGKGEDDCYSKLFRPCRALADLRYGGRL